jgi:phospholipase D-like protein
MRVDYIAQPNTQLGSEVLEILRSHPPPTRIAIVSAFVSVQTLLRLRASIHNLRDDGCAISLILGIDMGGTSKEALDEVLSWNVPTTIVKHRQPGHTFHPKIYLFEHGNHATIVIGSNNLTEGGFYSNYEGAARVVYEIPADATAYAEALDQLAIFLAPEGPTSNDLTQQLLDTLVARGDVPNEVEARAARRAARTAGKPRGEVPDSPFGKDGFPLPPPLPAELLERLVSELTRRRSDRKSALRRKKTSKKKPRPIEPVDSTQDGPLEPAAFYMTLPTLQGENIPGEGRIPLVALELAKDFWGWPDEYIKETSPRSGHNRTYWNWRPLWRIWSVSAPEDITTQQVRMYLYENSSDFRFYVRPLINAGADIGDIVRITRIAETTAEYECVLARVGTVEYGEWLRYCTQPVRNSTRQFGYV